MHIITLKNGINQAKTAKLLVYLPEILTWSSMVEIHVTCALLKPYLHISQGYCDLQARKVPLTI